MRFLQSLKLRWISTKMSSNGSSFKTFFAVLTSPIWVPCTAAVSLAAAPLVAVAYSVNDGDPVKGIANFPGYLVGSALACPVAAVAAVGDEITRYGLNLFMMYKLIILSLNCGQHLNLSL